MLTIWSFPLKKYTIVQSGSSTTITQAAVAWKSYYINTAIKSRILKKPFVHARATAYRSSLCTAYGTVRATAAGSHYSLVGRRTIKKKRFYLLHTHKKKINIEGFTYSAEDIVEGSAKLRLSVGFYLSISPPLNIWSTFVSKSPLSERIFFESYVTFFQLRIWSQFKITACWFSKKSEKIERLHCNPGSLSQETIVLTTKNFNCIVLAGKNGSWSHVQPKLTRNHHHGLPLTHNVWQWFCQLQ